MKRILLVVLCALLLAVPLAACAGREKPVTAAEMIAAGERYLLELDYEQALVCFHMAIELEPMNLRGYTGAAEAHVGLGEPDKALAILRQGQALLDHAELQELIERIEQDLPAETEAWPDEEGEASESSEQEQAQSEGAEGFGPEASPAPPLNAAAQRRADVLNNSGAVTRFGHISEYKGEVYASSFLCLPHWNAIPIYYMGGMAIHEDYVYYLNPLGTGGFPTELYRSGLQGQGATVIANGVGSWGNPRIANGKVIYETINENYEYTGTFCYDTATAETVRLSDERFEWLSYDDEFVYYQLDRYRENAGDMWRVRWDGSQEELAADLDIPRGIYKVEDTYFYTTNAEFRTPEMLEIVRYSIANSGERVAYTLPEGLDLLTIHEGAVYLSGETGVFKADIDSGGHIKLADLPDEAMYGAVRCYAVVGNDLYVSIYTSMEHDMEYVRLYKLPLGGGVMEYQNAKWFES